MLADVWFEFDSVQDQFLLSQIIKHFGSQLWWQVVEQHTVSQFVTSIVTIVSCTELAAIILL